jgi:hypothetical protein
MVVMKFLLFILMIRYVFSLLDKLGGKKEIMEEEEMKSIHPSEHRMR